MAEQQEAFDALKNVLFTAQGLGYLDSLENSSERRMHPYKDWEPIHPNRGILAQAM